MCEGTWQPIACVLKGSPLMPSEPVEASGTPDLAARIGALEGRMARLEAERDVLSTLYQLAHAIDYGEHDLWVDCFAADAVFQMVEVSARGRTVRVRHEGRPALAAFIPGHSSAPEYFHKHLTTVPMIQVDGDSATSVSYFARIDAGHAGPFLWSFGRYNDRLVRSADGRWRVAERILEVESRTQPPRPADIGAT